jgi:hypothetical protein
MSISQLDDGFVAVFRSRGFGRFYGATFLALWLVGWLAGEAFALWVLILGGWAFFSGHPPEPGRAPVSLEVAVVAGLFLIFWLSIWSLGGIMAGQEFFRLLFGKDRIVVRPDGVDVDHGYGLFHLRRQLRRDEVRRFYCRPGRSAACADTIRGVIELTQLGNWQERSALVQELTAKFQIVAEPKTDQLPPGWYEASSLEREAILIRDPIARRKQAFVAWGICMILTYVTAYLVIAAQTRPALWGLASVLAVLAIGCAAGAAWLSFGRAEWVLERGRLVLQRRFGQSRTRKFEATALELIQDNSGDGGPDYKLLAVAPNAPALQQSYRLSKHRRVIHSVTDDPTELRNLGLWLGQKLSIPFTDETTEEAKAKQLAEVREKLAASGRIGQFVLRLIDRIVTKTSNNSSAS